MMSNQKSADSPWQLLEVAPDATLVVDSRGTIVFANALAASVFGYERAELEGASVSQLIPRNKQHTHERYVEGFFASPSMRRMGDIAALSGRCKDGRVLPLDIALSPFATPEGLVTIAAIRDVSRRLQIEADLRLQLDWAPIGIVLLSEAGEIVQVNEAWKAFGRENGASEATVTGVGLNYLDACKVSAGGSAVEAATGLTRLLAGEADSCSVVYSCHGPENPRWFRMDGRRTNASHGTVVVIHTEVTAERQADVRSRAQAIVTRCIAEQRSIATTCTDLVACLCEGLDLDFAAVWVAPSDGNPLTCTSIWARPEFEWDRLDAVARSTVLPPDGDRPSPFGSGVAAWMERLSECEASPLVEAALSAGCSTAFRFAVVVETDTIAEIVCLSRIQRGVDVPLVEELDMIGRQLGDLAYRTRVKVQADAAAAEISRVREQLQALLECAPAVIVAVDRNGTIEFINRSVGAFDKDAVVGTNWLIHVPAADRPRLAESFRKVLDTGRSQFFEVAIDTPDSRRLCFASLIGPMRHGDIVSGGVVVAQDVTDLRRAEAELSAAQRLAAVGTLAAGVAHEINTPLQYVSDSVHFVRDAATDLFNVVTALEHVRQHVDDDDTTGTRSVVLADADAALARADLPYLRERVPDALERCLDGLARVTTIVKSMKEFAHPGSDEMAPADLNRAILNTVTLARNEYKYVADLETCLGELPMVMCHINEINQVVLNLIVNAAHAIREVLDGEEERGKIVVTTSLDGDEHVLISVSDTGCGIPPEIRDRIFEPFFTTKEVGKGTGQGLSLAWAIVCDKHHGSLRFTTEVGKGTTFLVRLPVSGVPDR